MTSQAHVEHDPMMRGVRMTVAHDFPTGRVLRQWPRSSDFVVTDENANERPPLDTWLQLTEDDARAVYEALADYFGHTGHDIRALRKDYDAERARVDRLITHITKETQ